MCELDILFGVYEDDEFIRCMVVSVPVDCDDIDVRDDVLSDFPGAVWRVGLPSVVPGAAARGLRGAVRALRGGHGEQHHLRVPGQRGAVLRLQLAGRRVPDVPVGRGRQLLRGLGQHVLGLPRRVPGHLHRADHL